MPPNFAIRFFLLVFHARSRVQALIRVAVAMLSALRVSRRGLAPLPSVRASVQPARTLGSGLVRARRAMVTLARSQTGHHLEITPTPTRVSLRWMRRLAGGSLLATGAVLGGIYSMDEGLWRSVRVLSSLVPMFADYHWTSFKLRNEADDSEAVLRAFDAYHHKWAREPLNAVLDLRGFYVKVGQMMAGFPGDGLPKPYKEQLLVLQEHVPAQPFEVIRGIVEAELGCPLEDVFSEFPEDPIGAASIGQVHLARLKHDGSRVVVKVQYPEVEKNFRMDFSTIMAIFEQINPEFVEPLEAMEECFKSEFNYSLEAANLRRMCAEVKPHFTR